MPTYIEFSSQIQEGANPTIVGEKITTIHMSCLARFETKNVFFYIVKKRSSLLGTNNAGVVPMKYIVNLKVSGLATDFLPWYVPTTYIRSENRVVSVLKVCFSWFSRFCHSKKL
jgi:hypothetical protein